MRALIKIMTFALLWSISFLAKGQTPYHLEMIKVSQSGSQVLDTLGIIPNGGSVYAGQDQCMLRMVADPSFDRSSVGKLYFTIFDLQPNGEVQQLFPNPKLGHSPGEFMITEDSPESFFLLNSVISFAPPYGRESFVVVFGRSPVSFFGSHDGPVTKGPSSIITVAELNWLLMGNPIEDLGELFISQYQFEIRSTKLLEQVSRADDWEVQEEVEDSEDDLDGLGGFDTDEDEALEVVLERHMVKNDDVYVKFPILSMINPPEPSWESTGRGVEVEDFESFSTAFVVKGTVASKAALQDVIVSVWNQDVGVEYYTNPQFRTIPQGQLFEQQVQLSEGVNTIIVKAITVEGFGITQSYKVNTVKTHDQAKGKDYLLIMSINDYVNWPKLNNAVNDARAMRKLLQESYGFEDSCTFQLTDGQCTRRGIDSTFRSLMRTLSEEDRLMVYFAGHGYYDSLTDVGYWIPAEAELGEYATYSFVSNSIISDYIKGLKSRHTLFISDACFSGNLCVADGRGVDDAYTANMDHFKSRWIFSSGRSEVVADQYQQSGHSPFAYFLLNYMKNPPNEVFTISELAATVTRSVASNSEQTPMARAIKNSGDEGGEFVFRYKP